MTHFWTCAAHLAEIGDHAKYFGPGETIHIVAESECPDHRVEAEREGNAARLA